MKMVKFRVSDDQAGSEPIGEPLRPLDDGASGCEPADNGATTATSSNGTEGGGAVESPPTANKKPGTEQEVLGPDALSEAAHKIENLVDENSAVTQIRELIEDSCFNYFKIGGILLVIRDAGWFLGHSTFAALCEEEFGFGKRKGEYLIDVYKFCLNAELNWEHLKAVGWTKMRLMSRLVNPKEALPWIEKAEAATCAQLQIELKKGASGDGGAGDEGGSPVKNMVFKPHEDQCETIEAAIEKAKKEVSTEFATVALEHVCMSYLTPGASTPKETNKVQEAADISPLVTLEEALKAVLKQHGDDMEAAMDEVSGVFEKVIPNVDVDVIIRE